MNVQDFELRYDDTILMAHVYVRANQDISKLQKNVIRAAKGPRLDAIAAWTEMNALREKLIAQAETFGDQRAAVEGFLRGSTENIVVFHLCVNTDADPRKLGENIQRAARGPRFDDVMCAIQIYTGSEGRQVWDLIQRVVRRAHADPATKPFVLQ